MATAATALTVGTDGAVSDPSTGEVLGTAVAIPSQARKLTMLRPIASPADIIAVQNETRSFVHAALKEGRDYGTIPGTDKKTLLKPGAERTALGFGCYFGDPQIMEQEVDHDREVTWRKTKAVWKYDEEQGKRVRTGEEITEGKSLGLYRYVVRVPVIHAESGRTVAVGMGACSTMESKYVDRPRDSENTVLKMAHKRALVAAALLAFGLSDEFTQDVEDMPHVMGDGAAPATGSRSGGSSAPAGDAGDFRMPFGKTKGTALKQLDDDEIRGAVQWAESKGKFKELVAAGKAVLAQRAGSDEGNGAGGAAGGSRTSTTGSRPSSTTEPPAHHRDEPPRDDQLDDDDGLPF